MFKSAATKLAHNSTIPALAGNKDFKALQELITAEKSVLQSLQKLSADFLKAGECLRLWGVGEGEDMADILAASTHLLYHFATALSQFAIHEGTVREKMKGVRTREEALDEMRRRRKAIGSKAEAAEKKLSKMSPEHKSLLQQRELLASLQDQIRTLDREILTEEAALGDFKRATTKYWMTLKFGGLLECAEKAQIVGELGRLVIEEIPLVSTQPGFPRASYTSYEKTQKLTAEAQRCINEVVFDPQAIRDVQPKSEVPPTPVHLAPQYTTNTVERIDSSSSATGAAAANAKFDGLPPTSGGALPPSTRPIPTRVPTGGFLGSAEIMDPSLHLDSFTGRKNTLDADEFGVSDRKGVVGTMPTGVGHHAAQQSITQPPATISYSQGSQIQIQHQHILTGAGGSGGHFANFPVRPRDASGSAGSGSGFIGTPVSAVPGGSSAIMGQGSHGRVGADGGFSTGLSNSSEDPIQDKYGDNIKGEEYDGGAPYYSSQGKMPEHGYTGQDVPPAPIGKGVYDYSGEQGSMMSDPAPREPPPHTASSPYEQTDKERGFTYQHDGRNSNMHRREYARTEDDTELAYAGLDDSGSAPPPPPPGGDGRPQYSSEDPAHGAAPSYQGHHAQQDSIGRLPTPPHMDEGTLNATAARALARELNALSMNPLPPPPPHQDSQSMHSGHSSSPVSSRVVSPQPAQPQPQPQQTFDPSLYGGWSRGVAGDVASPPPPPPPSQAQPQPYQQQYTPQRPGLGPTMATWSTQGSSPGGGSSGMDYSTPPEIPTTPTWGIGTTIGKPAALNISPQPQTKTISAAAFKRPQRMASGAVSPNATSPNATSPNASSAFGPNPDGPTREPTLPAYALTQPQSPSPQNQNQNPGGIGGGIRSESPVDDLGYDGEFGNGGNAGNVAGLGSGYAASNRAPVLPEPNRFSSIELDHSGMFNQNAWGGGGNANQ